MSLRRRSREDAQAQGCVGREGRAALCRNAGLSGCHDDGRRQPLEAFAAANTETRQPLYRLTIASMAAEPVEASLGIRLFPSVAASRIAGRIDTLLGSGGHGQVEARTNPALLKWLRIQGRKARRCGLETMDRLRRAFVRRFGITPQRYRERFC